MANLKIPLDVAVMPERTLSTSRILSWLDDGLSRAAQDMDCSKVQVNSAAIWWFCQKLPPEERARVLGEFVTAQALRSQPPPPPALADTPPPRGVLRRRKSSEAG